MARPDKATAVAELAEGFRRSSAVVLTEYRGLSVTQLKELRRSLGSDVTYAVVKNTLTKIAAREADVAGLDDLLAGPSAIAFVSGDPVVAAKGLRDFARANPLLVIKGGVMDGRPLSPDEIRKLADLESREVLLAKLAGAMKASLSNAVSLFAAPLSQTARLVEALRQQAEQDPSILRGGAGTPDVEAAPAAEAAPVAEATEAPAETTAEVSTDETAEAPAETTAEVSTDETAEAPAPAAADENAAVSAETPAEESSETTTETTTETAEAPAEETTEG
jgi:large subunit ribosomal protein L10